MSLPQVTFQIVTWNSRKFLADCLKSIFAQTYRDFQVLIVDNNSQDGTVEFLKANYPQVTVFQNNKNVGFAKAHNQGLQLLNSPYVVVTNPDILLTETWLEKMMEAVHSESYRDYGSFGGKLLKLKVLNDEYHETEQTTTIDSCGLKLLKNHRFVELGAGEASENFTESVPVFGQSGALVLYRREALLDVAFHNASQQPEFFDEIFFTYKEDIDLAWRLQLGGWKSVCVAQAEAYHIRTMQGSEKMSRKDIRRQRKEQSPFAKYYSYRNHWLLLLKNQSLRLWWRYGWVIMWYEMKKLAYVVLFETRNLKVFFEIIGLLPTLYRKRRTIFSRSKVGAQYIDSFISR
jgi:GT2 family glycosyltransferase